MLIFIHEDHYMDINCIKIQWCILIGKVTCLFFRKTEEEEMGVTIHKNLFFRSRLSYENSSTALIKRRNVAGSDTSPVVTASANDSPRTKSSHWTSLYSIFFSRHIGGSMAEICCTIIEKLEQLVSQKESICLVYLLPL